MVKYIILLLCCLGTQIASAQQLTDSTVLKIKSFQRLMIHNPVPPRGMPVPRSAMTRTYTPIPIKGKVIHIEGNTFDDLPVKLAPKTDKNGEIELKLPAGTYTIKFGGHNSEIKTIELMGHPLIEFTHVDDIVQGEMVPGVHPPIMHCECEDMPAPKIW